MDRLEAGVGEIAMATVLSLIRSDQNFHPQLSTASSRMSAASLAGQPEPRCGIGRAAAAPEASPAMLAEALRL